jgi:hypothetical protein
MLFLTFGMLLLYPLLFIRRLRLPSWTQLRQGNFALRPSQQRTSKIQLKKYSIIVLYFGILVAAIVGTNNLANTRQRNAYDVYSPQDWSGSYIVLSPFSNLVYSSAGVNQGEFDATSKYSGWTVKYNIRGSIIAFIDYSGSSPTKFNASCFPTLSYQNYSICSLGGFVEQPIPNTEGHSNSDPRKPEFTGYLNLTITTLHHFPITYSSKSNVWTSPQAYQGIGGVYLPLGEWYLNNSILLQVMWMTGEGGPCGGLQINLSEEYESTAWILAGIIWQWWYQWIGNCYSAAIPL